MATGDRFVYEQQEVRSVSQAERSPEQKKPLERRQQESDSYSLAVKALIPIVQEMGTVISCQLPVISYPGVVIPDG